jgi:hypothetical protein
MDALRYWYTLPKFKVQVKGREKDFLRAHVTLLKQCVVYIDAFDAQRIGTRVPFYAEPLAVADVGLMLAKQIDPGHYTAMEGRVRSMKLKKEQDLHDIRQYLGLVIRELEGVLHPVPEQ